MKAFEFFTPTQIIFGRGCLAQIAEEAKKLGEKTLLVTDKGLMKTGLVDPIIAALKTGDVAFDLWTDIVPNPRDVDIERGAEYARAHGIDSLIAIGGGSSMDTAKAIGALMTNGGVCADWIEGNLKHPIAPLLCVPTTCGTGSEVTHESIVNNTKTLEKDCIWGPENSVTTAMIDSTVIDHLPGSILGSTGMDALTHAVEAYVCKAANPLTNGVALSAIRLISDHILSAVQNHDPESLDAMMAASTLAGIAFGNADVASVHSISEALGGFYDIPHGVANAIFLAPVSRYSLKGAVKRYADVAKTMGISGRGESLEDLASQGVDRMAALADRLEIPKFNAFEQVDPKDFPRLAKTAAKADETEDNPVMMNEQDFIEVMTAVYEGRL
ncbi:iron-containing alcohol dehydrogenase [Pseudoramibacter sp.]|uniref:iron-containing alcohol dehydrogenase n=1 Tax=Pseudoramibacter sp. TaxID=2034862 RepID=UPI0025DBAF78|nr:iron-containing alcohol dehydrogenase [Pseudoramibacter sp.]MCH4072290.1 iron-containing alcohol dehydrogenase [Pseudoramibacter sp.]MCH4106061.1 iron-containing alcohol dehydrogenase [Pseudoramibacter sp.]